MKTLFNISLAGASAFLRKNWGWVALIALIPALLFGGHHYQKWNEQKQIEQARIAAEAEAAAWESARARYVKLPALLAEINRLEEEDGNPNLQKIDDWLAGMQVLVDYLADYPKGAHAVQARGMLDKLLAVRTKKWGNSPLHMAAHVNADKAAALLIEKGADIHAKNKYGFTPLHSAVWGNADKIAALLIEKGADIHAKNKYGSTPLHLAAGLNVDKTAALLIEKGADINAKNKEGYTPLHFAVIKNADKAAALLIEKGADIHARDNIGETPLDYAKRRESDKVAELLKRNGGY